MEERVETVCAPSVRGAARRSEIRIPVRRLGTLSCPGRAPAKVEIADLSRGGACCRAAAPPPVGSRIGLRLDTLDVQGIVCWVAGSRVGLRFASPLRASDILIQSSRSRSGQGQDHPLHELAMMRVLRQPG